jgi:6-phosphogluconolactonase
MSYSIKHRSLIPAGSWFSANPGSGPRHGLFSPSAQYAYIINELDSSVDVLAYTPAAPESFQRIQNISVLPGSTGYTNTAAAIKIAPDARFLYTSNRGYDSIAVFRILSTGLLEPAGIVPSGGVKPRDFAIDPSGRFLLVCHQDSDNLVVFGIDETTGLLQKKREYPAASGTCVIFA